MPATKDEISKWFDRGVEQKAKFMLILCDRYDFEDYPVYAQDSVECVNKYDDPGEMQIVMEVYDLNADKYAQINCTRAMHLPTRR